MRYGGLRLAQRFAIEAFGSTPQGVSQLVLPMAVAVSGGHGIGGDGAALLTLVAEGDGLQQPTGAGVYTLPINMVYGDGYAVSSIASFTIPFVFATTGKASVIGVGAATGVVSANGSSTALVSGSGTYSINLQFGAFAQIGTDGIVGGTAAVSVLITPSAVGIAAVAGTSDARITVMPMASGVIGAAGNCAFKLVPIVHGSGARGHILSGAAKIKLLVTGSARRGNSGSAAFGIGLAPSATGIVRPLFSGVGSFVIDIDAAGFASTPIEYLDVNTIYVKSKTNAMVARL